MQAEHFKAFTSIVYTLWAHNHDVDISCPVFSAFVKKVVEEFGQEIDILKAPLYVNAYYEFKRDGEKLRQLLWTFLQLAALLSIGVGFFNLLPIPVLDGGAVVMNLAEGVTGKPIPEKVQNVGLTIGLVCLVTFALLITVQDSLRLPWGS